MNSFQTKPLFETSKHYEVWKNDFEDLLKVINVLNDFQIQYFSEFFHISFYINQVFED